ncbi:uncharacterized protein LOC128594665 [Nycticebus coucang]|uniref:uncharacterized protein LOC128594665 n=1 Tax=Nycticebus coucang TaxID=9470 RepID=UPI00234C5D95|nr:uncharacterized protein LOC128594665 [Nycticebus coucang]
MSRKHMHIHVKLETLGQQVDCPVSTLTAAKRRGAARAGTVGARVPAPRARAADAARPHLLCEARDTHPNDVSLRPSRRHRRLLRLLRSPLVATASCAAAVAAVLVAAAAATAARVRFHAHRRGRARVSARWRHLATRRPRPGGVPEFRVQRSPPAGSAAFAHPPDPLPLPSRGRQGVAALRHLAPVSPSHPRWSAMASQLTVTSNSRAPAILLPQPPKQLGPQAHATTPDYFSVAVAIVVYLARARLKPANLGACGRCCNHCTQAPTHYLVT